MSLYTENPLVCYDAWIAAHRAISARRNDYLLMHRAMWAATPAGVVASFAPGAYVLEEDGSITTMDFTKLPDT